MRIAFFGSSLVSSYWNGAATYYRGLIAALARRGHSIAFYEPDAYDRQAHRDIDPPDWASVIVYPAEEGAARAAVAEAADADVIVKASGVGVFDDLLVDQITRQAGAHTLTIYWDVDAPATLAALETGGEATLARALHCFDAVFTYGGGRPVIERYLARGARACHTIYNGLDPAVHHPARPDPRFEADLAFLGHRLPDREVRVDEFFFRVAEAMPERRFLLGGCGWESRALPANVHWLGHVGTADHNAFNVTPLAVLNIARESMAANGFSPATRVFEAAGAGACLITDHWLGVELFFDPGGEILVARDGGEVAALLRGLDRSRAEAIGRAALARALADHSYETRATEVDRILRGLAADTGPQPKRLAPA